MSFQIELSKKARAYATLVREVQASLQETFAEEASSRGLTQADIARELNLDESVISRRLNGSGNFTLRTISEMFAAMDREPLSNFLPPEAKAVSHQMTTDLPSSGEVIRIILDIISGVSKVPLSEWNITNKDMIEFIRWIALGNFPPSTIDKLTRVINPPSLQTIDARRDEYADAT